MSRALDLAALLLVLMLAVALVWRVSAVEQPSAPEAEMVVPIPAP
ncbi:hypothetical protein [Alloactinosynnema sp. L-07]|nr:hypothetical protein [Alloactinosynnema sp. L-07]